MQRYARVVDGLVVDGPSELPVVWDVPNGVTISGFHHMSDAEVLEYGWYRFIEPVEPSVGFDPETQEWEMDNSQYTIDYAAHTVTCPVKIRDKGPEGITGTGVDMHTLAFLRAKVSRNRTM